MFIDNKLKRSKIMMAFAATYIILFLVWLIMSYINSAAISVIFKYNNIAKGLNPDGTHFNIYEIVSDDVLNDVCNQIGNSTVTTSRLKKCFSIHGSSDISRQDAVERAVTNGDIPNLHCTSKYTIKCNTSFMYVPANKVINALIPAYKDFFINNHIENTSILKPDLSYLKNTDDLKSAEYLEMCLNEIYDFAYRKYAENSDFVSGSTKKSFNDIAVMSKDIMANELYNFKIFAVNSSSINREKARIRYDNLKTTYEKLYGIYTMKYNANSKASLFYKNKSNPTYLDKAASDYYSNIALKYQSDIEYIQSKETNSVFMGDIRDYTRSLTNADNDYTEQMLDDIADKVKNLSDIAVKTEDDYISDTLNCTPVFSSVTTGPSLIKIIIYFLGSIVLGFVSGLIAVHLMGIIPKQTYIPVLFDKICKKQREVNVK